MKSTIKLPILATDKVNLRCRSAAAMKVHFARSEKICRCDELFGGDAADSEAHPPPRERICQAKSLSI